VTPESNSTQNDFEFKKKVLVTTILEVMASFLLITETLPIGADLVIGALDEVDKVFLD